VRFFFDNCIAYRVAEALAILTERDGYEIIALRSRFPEDCPDEVWMPALGQEGGWIVLSGDRKIYTNAQRRRIWASAKLTTFFLANAWMSAAFTERQKAARLLARWDDIVEWAGRVQPGTALNLPIKGGIAKLL
jgi:PIN like domain